MKGYRDASGRLFFYLSDDEASFTRFADRMTTLHGSPTEKLDGLEQRYWDFSVNEVTVVLHSDVMAGVAILVEDGSHDDLLRAIVKELTREDTEPG